jgi:hypothetical protein
MSPVTILALVWAALGLPAGDTAAGGAQSGPSAVLVEASGPVEVLAFDAETWTSCAPGTPLGVGDTVRTGHKGRALIKIGERIELRLGSRSSVEIGVDDEEEVPRPSASLLLGVLWTQVTHPEGGETPFEVHTGNAVAGVRGTRFVTAVGLDGLVRTQVEDGKVAFAGDTGEVEVTAGMASEAADEAKPGEATKGGFAEVDWEAWQEGRRVAARDRADELAERIRGQVEALQARIEQLRVRRAQVVAALVPLAKQARMARRSGQREVGAKIRGRIVDLLVEERHARRAIRRAAVRLVARLSALEGLVEELGMTGEAADSAGQGAKGERLRAIFRELKASGALGRAAKRIAWLREMRDRGVLDRLRQVTRDVKLRDAELLERLNKLRDAVRSRGK